MTFTRDLAPLLIERCAMCHRPGGQAPFSVLTYGDVAPHAKRILEMTQSRRMPPWLPDPGYGSFAGERRLTDPQLETIRRWVEQGANEGDRRDLPPSPQITEGWQLGQPDLIVKLLTPFALSPRGGDVLRNFVIPIPVSATHFVRTVELRPGGSSKFVHHAVGAIDQTRSARRADAKDRDLGFGGMDMGGARPPDGHLVVWTPGMVPFPGVEGAAWRLEPGTDLVLQLHMMPTGKDEVIQPSVGFYFAETPPVGPPLYLMRLYADEALDIPAGEKNFIVTDTIPVPADVEVLAVYPHAHYLAKSVEAWAMLPDGHKEWLIRISEWNFDWQDVYRYAKPVKLPRGTTVTMQYRYDNSVDNERNPTVPPRRVLAGDRSSDEMAHLWLQLRPRSTEDIAVLREARMQHAVTGGCVSGGTVRPCPNAGTKKPGEESEHRHLEP